MDIRQIMIATHVFFSQISTSPLPTALLPSKTLLILLRNQKQHTSTSKLTNSSMFNSTFSFSCHSISLLSLRVKLSVAFSTPLLAILTRI